VSTETEAGFAPEEILEEIPKARIEQELDRAWREAKNPTLKADHVRHTLAAITESAIAIRNAARVGKLDGTPRQVWNLADEVEHVGRQLYALADELRRNAK
jgi:hypothetical protein